MNDSVRSTIDRSIERVVKIQSRTPPSRIKVLISWKHVCNSWRDSRLGFSAIAYQFEADRSFAAACFSKCSGNVQGTDIDARGFSYACANHTTERIVYNNWQRFVWQLCNAPRRACRDKNIRGMPPSPTCLL